ncbi:MAG TPA: HAMP domain-containing sensor histidine kinase [Polyangia bacterium]|nr:HAMP domain-containing sensor histidine kinase [Polyangia bacterium]
MTVKELQHLAAAMAHEVRNPLNSMAIHVELLEGRMRKEGVGAEIMKSLSVLASEIDRVDKILEQYLGYAGPQESARAPVQARTLLAAVVERVRGEAESRGVKVELTDGGGGDARWAVDADALTEALVAIAENAVTASPKGSVVAIAARTDAASEQAEVTIVDGAAPIAAAELAKVFHIGSPRARGSVGLTVAKQIVKGHGGSITVKPQAAGNLFTIRLPLEFEI